MPADPLLEIEDLSIAFRTQSGLVQAVAGVSFSVAEKEILGIVGESGSGKSQTLLAILGLIDSPNALVSGSVRFLGQELLGLRRRALNRIRGRQIAMVFQDPMTALTPVYSIGRQIVEQLRAHGSLSTRAARTRATELLAAVGFPSPRMAFGRFPHELSGGMRQRAVIAMALSCNPRLLIADEPTTALDVTVQAQILDLLLALREEFGSAVILVTHDLGVVAETADRVLVMYGGQIAETAPKPELFRDPQHPYTWGLLASIPPIEGVRPERLSAIPGAPPKPGELPAGCAFAPRCRFSHAACAARPRLAGARHAVACFLDPETRPALRAQAMQAAI